MTVTEIIKGLEKELHHADYHDLDYEDTVPVALLNSAYNLIKRQQMEIERLESIINTDNQMIKSLNKCYETSKAKAIKEFADRLGNYKEYRYNENCDFVPDVMPYVRLSDIDKVVKEMIGAEK